MIVPRCAYPELITVNTRFVKSPIESLSLDVVRVNSPSAWFDAQCKAVQQLSSGQPLFLSPMFRHYSGMRS
jgi:hypothetical protein